jgi:phosphoribosylglycinamide formyltransferase-1
MLYLRFPLGLLEEILSAKRCNVAVLASGTGSNFRAIVEASSRNEIPARVSCLITDNPEAPAINLARSYDVEACAIVPPTTKARLPVETEEEIVRVCKERDVDLIALAGFMRILNGPLLDEYDGRIMNIHPSLLPSFKGLHAVGQALEYGVKVAGCTVHFVDKTVDGGAIIVQAAVTVDETDTEDTLLDKIHAEEHRIYPQAIALFAAGRLQRENRRVKIMDGLKNQ